MRLWSWRSHIGGEGEEGVCGDGEGQKKFWVYNILLPISLVFLVQPKMFLF